MTPRTLFTWSILMLVTAGSALGGQEVIRQPQSAGDLAHRWAWAQQEAAHRGEKRYWIGYSIVKMMPEGSFTGTFYSDERRNRPALREVLAGTKVEEIAAGAHGSRLVPKEVAFLFSIEPSDAGAGRVREVRISNLTLHVELDRKPLFWLEGAPDGESTALLSKEFAESDLEAVKEDIVQGIGMHEESALALPFLRSVIAGNEPKDLRSRAAMALGQIRSAESLALLGEAVEHDPSEEVRAQAVEAIGQMDSAFGLETVIRFARDRRLDAETRRKAISALSQIASAKAVRTLSEITEKDEDAEVQRQALYALAQTEGGGIDAIIAIAKTNPNRKLRRDAIYMLGESDDPRAFETLLAIIRE